MDTIGSLWPLAENANGAFSQKTGGSWNRLRAFGLITSGKAISQRQLVSVMGLRASTVSNIVRELKEMGRIRDGGALEAERVGPKERSLEIVADAAYAAGLFLEAAGSYLVLIDATGKQIAKEELPRHFAVADLPGLLPKALTALCAKGGIAVDTLAGLCASVPGVVDAERGVVLISHALKLRDYPLRAELAQVVGCPVWVERNVTCGAYADHYLGLACDFPSFVYFLLHVDCDGRSDAGLALIIGERVFPGSNWASGEVSDWWHRRGDNEEVTISDANYLQYADALAAIVNLLDVSCLIFSSNDPKLDDVLFEKVKARVNEALLPVSGRAFRLERSKLGVNGIACGAALLALHRKLSLQML